MSIKNLFLNKTEKEIARMKELADQIAQLQAEFDELAGGETDEPPAKRAYRRKGANGQTEMPIK